MTTSPIPRLPKTAPDGTQVADITGNIFEFNTELKGWNGRGVIRAFEVVNEEQAGLITPDIYNRLKLIQKIGASAFVKFKLDADEGIPYFYLFSSTDDLVRFYIELQEGNPVIRFEVDRARLLQKLLRTTCIGPRGPKGAVGDTGTPGRPAALEKYYHPVVILPSSLGIDVDVETPIETDISVRLFKEDASAFSVEVMVPLSGSVGSTVKVVDRTVNATGSLTFESGRVIGSITVTGDIGDITKWQYKARQIGPKGVDGRDGYNFVEIVTKFFDDPFLKATEAIMSLRKSPIGGGIYFVKKNLFEEVCVGSLRAASGVLPIGSVDSALWVSTAVTTASCKNIGYFQFQEVAFEAPVLDLPAWEPISCCIDRTHHDQFKFDWFRKAEPVVPYTIVTDPIPPEQCCQADFFVCPNVGDNPCGMAGTIKPPVRPPSKCVCLDCPGGDQLQQGLELPPGDEEISVSCVVRYTDTYKRLTDIPSNKQKELVVKIEQNPNFCSGDTGEDCPFETMVSVETIGGVVCTPPGPQEITGGAGSVTFTCTGSGDGGQISTTVKVNTGGTECCRGYTMSIKATGHGPISSSAPS